MSQFEYFYGLFVEFESNLFPNGNSLSDHKFMLESIQIEEKFAEIVSAGVIRMLDRFYV
jgi:hypothetical protein